jgi:cytochrome c-type biogenesis protein CcmH/NrfG
LLLWCLQTEAKPDDAEAWRVLGEARLLNIDAKESVAAYEKALSLRPTDQTIISVSGCSESSFTWQQQLQQQW